MKLIETLLAFLRRRTLARSIARETSQRIVPQIKGRADYGYPFSEKKGLHKARLEGSTKLKSLLCGLDSAAMKSMDEVECNAFLYIAHRDLEERARMYLDYAQTRRRSEPAPQTLQPVATAA